MNNFLDKVPFLKDMKYSVEPSTLELTGGVVGGLVGATFLTSFLTKMFKLTGNKGAIAGVAIKLLGAGTALGYGMKSGNKLFQGVGIGFMASLGLQAVKHLGLSLGDAGVLGTNFANGLGSPSDESLDVENYQFLPQNEEYKYPAQIDLASEAEEATVEGI